MKSHVPQRTFEDSLEIADLGGAGRRAEPRYCSSRRVAILPCNATNDWKFLSAELIDCSRHGIGVIAPLAFLTGAQFLAKLKIERKAALLVYTVKYCIPVGKKFRIGAEFSGLTAASFRGDLDQLLAGIRSETG